MTASLLNARDWPLNSNPDDESYPVVLSENGPYLALTDSLDSNFIASFIIFALTKKKEKTLVSFK